MMDLDQSLSGDYLALISGDAIADQLLGTAVLFSDVTFCVEGRQVHAHRCILAARCHFFRLMFTHQFPDTASPASPYPPITAGAAGRPLSYFPSSTLTVPIDVVGFDAFLSLLRFLYSGRLILSPQASPHPNPPSALICPLPSCPHSSCPFAINLLLQLISAAHFFGVHQLAEAVQARLGNAMEEGVSVENLVRVLVSAKKHRMHRLWQACADIVIRTGLDRNDFQDFLPREIVAELAGVRLQRSSSFHSTMPPYDRGHLPQNPISSPSSCSTLCSFNGAGPCCSEEQRILRLQLALDCMDVELVRLMVMGEGLDLDKALALHYSVSNCSREVVKALLELGVVDVNHSDALGRTALHLAADMGNAEMIAVLLDHHADPNVLTRNGLTAADILRSLARAANHDNGHPQKLHLPTSKPPPLCKAAMKRVHLCIELLQSAAAVAGRAEEAAESSCVTQAAAAAAHVFNKSLHQGTPAFLPHDHQAAAHILNKNLNQESPQFLSHDQFVGLNNIIGRNASSCGLGLVVNGSCEPAISMQDDQKGSALKFARSSDMGGISCALRLSSNDSVQLVNDDVPRRLNQPYTSSSLALSCRISPPAVISTEYIKHSAKTPDYDLNHLRGSGQITRPSSRVSETNPNGGLLIIPGDGTVPDNALYELHSRSNRSAAPAFQDLQSTNRAATALQDGKSVNNIAGTGSSSED